MRHLYNFMRLTAPCPDVETTRGRGGREFDARLLASVCALFLAALACATPARAADHTHKFLHNDYDKSHCWTVSGNGLTAPAMTLKNAGPVGPNMSPGLSIFGDGITAAEANYNYTDPQLAVSPKYVLVLEAHRYVFYDRANNQPLAAEGCVPLNGSFSDLFAPLLLPTDPATNANNKGDINYQLEFGTNPKFPCDPKNFLDPPAPAPPSGCIQGNYDARAYFDYDTRRFWIIAAARNHLGPCPTSGPPPSGPCGDEARRYVFVAVSKDEDPRKGFWEYTLVRDYADWPLFSVRNQRLIIGHNGGKRIYVFDSKKLLSGTTTDPFLGQYLDASFPESDTITTVTQYSDADGLSLLLGRSGSKLTVYAFKDPTKPLVKKTQTLTVAPSWAMQPVYRFEKFYFTDDACDGTGCPRHRVDVHVVTASLKGSPVTVGAFTDKDYPLKHSNASLRMPGVIIEENGSAIVWYLQFPSDGTAQQARYQVLYPNESGFRASAVLRASDKAADETFIGDKDIGGAAEPGKLGFWITHIYSDSGGKKLQTVGEINPVAPAGPPKPKE
ncbi:MAG TPA: hypothetical protein VFA21_13645 [Pyrinomonadaceae bacterium]|nr:hypothetical protein [Pyrinomonadaceae bacterium]